jgi:nitronate monooxygenase
MPSLNARPAERLDDWLNQIEDALSRHDQEHPYRPSAPYAVNLIAHQSNQRLEHDLRVCEQHKVPIIITSLGSRPELNQAVHGWGGIVFHDVINQTFAHKAVDRGADGLILVCAGAGGKAGTTSPLAFTIETREWFSGPLVLGGGIGNGRAIRAAQILGADLAYVGSIFIATHEANAQKHYKQMIIDGAADEIIYTDAFTGIHANYLKSSIRHAGLDPEALKRIDNFDLLRSVGEKADNDSPSKKAWRDIWGCGQGIGSVRELSSVNELVARLCAEYDSTPINVDFGRRQNEGPPDRIPA